MFVQSLNFQLTMSVYYCKPLKKLNPIDHQLIKKEKQMTKAELIEKMAKDAGISKTAAGAALSSFIDGVTKALKKKDGKVTLVGFGTFSKARRKARKGRNPQTGEVIKIKASKTVKFKAGKTLKDAV